jgi:hypothetical protein
MSMRKVMKKIFNSEGISQEENTWRYIGGIFGQYFWKELEGDYSRNIWAVFLERI